MGMLLAADNQRVATLRRWVRQPALQLWGYLLLVTLAELITSLVSAQLGQLSHILILLALLLHAALTPPSPGRRLILALTLAPLIRVLSLALPLLRFPQLAWYPLTAIPLLLAALIVIRQLRLSRGDLGLRRGYLPLQLLITSIGCALGAIEFVILRPAPLLSDFTWASFGLAALSLLIFTGFSEELIFRGVLQTVATPALGRWGIVYVAILFGILHIGYLSLIDVLFVSAVGLLFAYIVRWSGSILGVTLAHGSTNIMLFLVMPFLDQRPELAAAINVPVTIGLGTLLAMLAAALLFWLHRFAQLPRPAAHPLGVRLRELRVARGLSRAALARHAGLTPGRLAELELGADQPQPADLQRLADALAVDRQLLLPAPDRRVDEDEEEREL